MVGPADAGIDVVGTAFVVDQMRDGLRRRHVLVGVDLGGADAKSGAAKQVIDFRVQLSHGGYSERDRQNVVRKRGGVLTE